LQFARVGQHTAEKSLSLINSYFTAKLFFWHILTGQQFYNATTIYGYRCISFTFVNVYAKKFTVNSQQLRETN